MTPKLEALKVALERMDRCGPYGFAGQDHRREMLVAASAAGFDPKRAAEDWARYQIAVGEARDDLEPVEEPEPESLELFAGGVGQTDPTGSADSQDAAPAGPTVGAKTPSPPLADGEPETP